MNKKASSHASKPTIFLTAIIINKNGLCCSLWLFIALVENKPILCACACMLCVCYATARCHQAKKKSVRWKKIMKWGTKKKHETSSQRQPYQMYREAKINDCAWQIKRLLNFEMFCFWEFLSSCTVLEHVRSMFQCLLNKWHRPLNFPRIHDFRTPKNDGEQAFTLRVLCVVQLLFFLLSAVFFFFIILFARKIYKVKGLSCWRLLSFGLSLIRCTGFYIDD